MRALYHGRNEIDLDVGDILRFTDVAGRIRSGILLRVDQPVPPRNLTYFWVLEGGTVSEINTNLIFRCARV